jgi:acetoin:2,6-dichlorophenolindophenol oxidoreductase subunit alpha
MLAVEVDGQDVRAVYNAAEGLVQRARNGNGPAFLLCHTYRYRGHHVGDIDRTYYRSKEEEDYWITERDPLKNLSQWMIDNKLSESALFEQIEKEIEKEVEEAVAYAINAPYPDVSEVDQHVYA